MKKLLLVGVLALGVLGVSQSAVAAKITEQQLREIIAKHVPNGQITKIELDREWGKEIYEVEVMDGLMEKDFDIDANTGEVLKID